MTRRSAPGQQAQRTSAQARLAAEADPDEMCEKPVDVDEALMRAPSSGGLDARRILRRGRQVRAQELELRIGLYQQTTYAGLQSGCATNGRRCRHTTRMQSMLSKQ
jgi:hypothetical protein